VEAAMAAAVGSKPVPDPCAISAFWRVLTAPRSTCWRMVLTAAMPSRITKGVPISIISGKPLALASPVIGSPVAALNDLSMYPSNDKACSKLSVLSASCTWTSFTSAVAPVDEKQRAFLRAATVNCLQTKSQT
jgi:hypothetical protein